MEHGTKKKVIRNDSNERMIKYAQETRLRALSVLPFHKISLRPSSVTSLSHHLLKALTAREAGISESTHRTAGQNGLFVRPQSILRVMHGRIGHHTVLPSAANFRQDYGWATTAGLYILSGRVAYKKENRSAEAVSSRR